MMGPGKAPARVEVDETNASLPADGVVLNLVLSQGNKSCEVVEEQRSSAQWEMAVKLCKLCVLH